MKKIIVYIAVTLISGSIVAREVRDGQRKSPDNDNRNRAMQFSNTCQPASQSVDLDINNVRTKILNGGDMWWDLNNPKYEVPKVNDPNAVRKHSLFSGALWIGGKDNGGNLKLAAMTYRQRGSDFWPGPIDTGTASTDPGRCLNYDQLWKVTRDELEIFEASGFIDATESIQNWPATRNRAIRTGNESRFLAPYVDNGGDPLEYNYLDGDHPVLDNRRAKIDNGVDKQPDMFIWYVYNDKGNIHSETQGQSIGIEIQTTAFAYSTNDEINNMTFYSSVLSNKSFSDVSECYMGQWVDADLGNYADDYVGCDVGRSLGYCYNGDDDDEGVLGYGLNPPTVGVDYFEGPNDDMGNQMGLSHFMYYNNDQNPNTGNPNVAIEFYNLLQGKWLKGQQVTFGGTGFGGSRPTKYMFSGGTDPDFPGECWDEKSAGNAPADRRFLQSTGPFTMKAGESQRITTGVVWARTTSGGAGAPCAGSNQGSLALLKLASDKAQTLFNNKFKILDGPEAPDVEIQELDNEIILKLMNTQSKKVEQYVEPYKDANNNIKTYKFEGYLIYQLKDGTVNTGDLDNVDKARLLFQADIKNGRAQIINKVFDPKLSVLIPVEKVDGADDGLVHTISVKNDLFATTANTQLVNFMPYYYMVLSYAILADDSLQVDPNQFLAGRRNIATYKAIPHNIEPEGFGTRLMSGYGSGPQLTRIEGRGNGGNVLEFTDQTIQEILQNNFSAQPVYLGGFGPVKVKVVDPVKVPKADFELVFVENKATNAAQNKDSISSNTSWFLVNKTSGDTIFSDTTIAYKFESVQGVRSVHNPSKHTLADWGLSIEIEQVKNPGENIVADPSNGFISYSVEWEDNGKQWLTAVVDNDAQSTPTSGSIWLNWIRSGQNGRNATFDPYYHSFFQQTAPNENAFDPSSAFQKIWNGRIAPYALVARETYSASNGRNTFGFAYDGGSVSADNPLSELASIELVITPDKAKWTRSPVLEMADDEVLNSTEGNTPKFHLRAGASKDQNGNVISGTGLSWFPGYCYNMETGERLAIAFGEDSYLPGENGRDMLWNPTQNIYNDNGTYPAIGGKHFIYIFSTGYSFVNRTQKGERYMGPDESNFQRFRDNLSGSATSLVKRRFLSQVMYVIPAYLAGGYTMNNGVPPTWVKFKINIKKAYTTFNANATTRNNGRPLYTFNTNDIAPQVTTEFGTQSLDMVNVVPNPYRGYSRYETSPIDSRVKITNLPPTCTVTIFDMAGNLIRKFNKADEKTFLEWDLKNGSNVPIASGLYLIHVKSDKLGEKIVRWYGIMHSVDLDSY